MKKTSLSAETKKLIIELLSSKPETPFSSEEIRSYVDKNVSRPITPGIFSGALFSLTKDLKTNVSSQARGQYVFIDNNRLSLKLVKILEETIEKITDESNAVNVFEIETNDLPKLRKISEIINNLKLMKKQIEELD